MLISRFVILKHLLRPWRKFKQHLIATSTNSIRPSSYDIVQPWLFQDPSPWVNIQTVPSHIRAPSYGDGTPVGQHKKQTDLHNPERLAGIRRSCQLARKTLEYVGKHVKPGVSTADLDNVAFEFIVKHNAYPSPLNYSGYPKSICTSVNNVACHGIPDSRQLIAGDIVNVDVTVFLGGYHGDCSKTFPVGEIDEKAEKLLHITELALRNAISICRNGQSMSEIGEIIEKTASDHGYSVIPFFCGHGIGEDFHMLPDVIHRANIDETIMETGMVFTIEPVVSEGSDKITILEDGWTAISVDNSRSAQFEETILIKEDCAEILTVAHDTIEIADLSR
ncbi:methionine aminopeptidase A-like [Paramacrobiotus metropolitanus]|uniref:methionine aminopeptidase A-like n=1 Tax=Paramacrobiotus metropolitanus TaxID=2943436 RepID=UPI0024464C6B|nr:methionine aminopeptidase A-like [Paramacrobiotus metropolitanus]XP_055331702.1 methionine aminopeptidase A-like [Paramacrobiotus metropolitanus]